MKTETPQTLPFFSSVTRRSYVSLLLLALLLYVAVPQLENFQDGWTLLGQASWGWVAAGLLAWAVSLVAAAAVYVQLSVKKVSLWRLIQVQLAACFTNRLMPAGLGAMGTNARYLYRQGHSKVMTSIIIVANQLIGLAGMLLVLLLVNLWSLPKLFNMPLSAGHVLIGLVVLAAAMVLMRIFKLIMRPKIRRFWKEAIKAARSYGRRPKRLAWALFSSVMITLALVACLYCTLRALGFSLPIEAVLLVYLAGSVAGSVTPTPGGLGGVEAALAAGLVAAGLYGSQALAVALLFRFLTLWLPLLPGFFTFRFMISRKYI